MTVKEGTDHHKAIFDQCNRLMAAVAAASVPVIAAVDGVAAAAGCQLVAMCDIAVATEKSKAGVSLSRHVPHVLFFPVKEGEFVVPSFYIFQHLGSNRGKAGDFEAF